MSINTYFLRRNSVHEQMKRCVVDAVIVTPSSDFLYLTGCGKKPSQRHTALVFLPGRSILIIPRIEISSLQGHTEGLELLPYSDTQDAVSLIADLLPGRGRAAVGREMCSGLLLALQQKRPSLAFTNADVLLVPLRSRKSAQEIETIHQAQRMAERALMRLLHEPLVGKSEIELSRRLRQLRLKEGFDAVGSGIVASGENTAYPHHTPGNRIVREGDVLLFDIGGTYRGYHADFTRTYAVGRVPEGFKAIYDVVHAAFEAGVQAAQCGRPAAAVDRAARCVIEEAGYGEFFTHRLGHGIGLDVHEPPYISSLNQTPLENGDVFSCEPGIYLPGRYGVRIEDLLAIENCRACSLNSLDHALQIL